ncbi:MAG: hypothetical protein PUB47_01535 [Bacteroides sp.]|nr:hypothetical protein [Bacteroides sp.]
MITNIFTNLPKIGDAVVGERSTKKVKFITLESFDNASLSSDYETIGVVYNRRGRKVKIVYKNNAGKTWSSKWVLKLSGYTLDGTSRTGVITFRPDSSATENTDVTVTYNTTTLQGLVNALNTAFAANATMVSQHWVAYINGSDVNIEHDYTFRQQSSYNDAKSGFTATAALMPEVESVADIRRRHGGGGGEGVISSWERALAFFRTSTGTETYQGYVPSPIANVKDRAYPIALQPYLGANCAEIRKVFGEGEQGWLNCMAAYMSVCPTDYGNMGMRDGLARTKLIASYKDTFGEPVAPAANYCYNVDTVALPKGNWYLPTVEDLTDLLRIIKYGTNGSVNSDPINKTLAAMGGNTISNGSSLWSCCRNSSYSAWLASGSYGFFSNNALYNEFSAVPVSLYIL